MTHDPEDHEHELQQQYEAGKVDGFEMAKEAVRDAASGYVADPDHDPRIGALFELTARAIAAMKVQP